jgi:HipA-like kinase
MRDTVTAVIKVLPGGGGFPSLVETTSGRRLVMKLSGVGQGPAGLATELIATRLARLIGLRVPAVEPIMLPADLPWQTGTDEFFDALRRSAGANLGLQFIEGATDVVAGELPELPATFLDRLAAADALLQNVDRTVRNPNLMRDQAGTLWAIDFGACLFLDRFARNGAGISFTLPAGHFLAGRRVAPLSIDISADQLNAIVAALPDSWIAQMPQPRAPLFQQLAGVLDLYRERPSVD